MNEVITGISQVEDTPENVVVPDDTMTPLVQEIVDENKFDGCKVDR